MECSCSGDTPRYSGYGVVVIGIGVGVDNSVVIIVVGDGVGEGCSIFLDFIIESEIKI